MNEKGSFEWVKKEFFSDGTKTLNIKKGETLLDLDQKNDKLFLVKTGKFYGYLADTDLATYPIFEATEDKFIGVYSYFSQDNKSYSRVVAAEDSVVSYYDKPLKNHSDKEWAQLAPFLISVVVNELYSRQHFARLMAIEKHHDVQRLLKAEKMATLGQMAAGIAHELNNSVGVLDRGTDHLKQFVSQLAIDQKGTDFIRFFNAGYEHGQKFSSVEARAQRNAFKKIKGLKDSQIKRLAKTGMDPDLIIQYLRKYPDAADRIYESWEAGCTIHDMHIASRHATHVVRSVKELGVSQQTWAKNININNSLEEALVILKNLSKRVDLQLSLDDDQPLTSGYYGQLIQVWINIIKNGIESMVGAGIPNPKLIIKSAHNDKYIMVSVTDNGPGIPKDIMNKIFEPSFTTKVGGLSFGLGLGLSIVQRIITEHDGKITVTSEPEKTIFTVSIPII